MAPYTDIVAKEIKKIKKREGQAQSSYSGIPIKYIGLLVGLLGALLYLQTTTFEYTQDDAIVINENMFTTQGVQGIPGLLGHDTFYGYFKDQSKTRLVSGGRYRPLTPVMFAIEYELAGLKPWLSHFVNALSYGFLCFIIFGFTKALLSGRLTSTIAFRIALITALVFAVHPIHTEVVANIKGRDEIMAAIGAIGGLWLMILSLNRPDVWYYKWVAALVFLLGMLSKENVITMLAVVPLTLWWYSKNKEVKWIPALLPIVAASVIFLGIRGNVTGWEKGKTPMELLNNPFVKLENNVYVPFSAGEKTATIMYAMGKYVQLLIFPYPLTHDYYPRHIEIQNWGKPLVIISLLFWLALLYVVVKGWKSRSWYAYGILFYVCTMSITSNVVFPIGTNLSERFAFLPSYGFALIAALAFARLMETKHKKTLIAAGLAILLLLTGWTLIRSRVWKDNHTLFTTDINTSARSAKLLNAVGGDLVTMSEDEKDPVEKRQMLLDAQTYLKRALEIHPNYKLSYLLLGNSHYHLKEYEQAITYFRHVLKLDPAYGEGRRNLGVVLREQGKVLGEKQNNLVGAIALLEEAVTYLPDDFETYHLLGVAYGQKGETQKAISFFRKEIELAPKNATAYYNLGVALRQAGNEAAANENFEKARALDPNLPQLQNR